MDPWQNLFWQLAEALGCLPSTFVDGNEHVLKRARLLMAKANANAEIGSPVVISDEEAFRATNDLAADWERAFVAFASRPATLQFIGLSPLKVAFAAGSLYERQRLAEHLCECGLPRRLAIAGHYRPPAELCYLPPDQPAAPPAGSVAISAVNALVFLGMLPRDRGVAAALVISSRAAHVLTEWARDLLAPTPGTKRVPLEPTMTMNAAGRTEFNRYRPTDPAALSAVFKAMALAAPKELT